MEAPGLELSIDEGWMSPSYGRRNPVPFIRGTKTSSRGPTTSSRGPAARTVSVTLVSLRTTASDVNGSSVSETITNAYQVAYHP